MSKKIKTVSEIGEDLWLDKLKGLHRIFLTVMNLSLVLWSHGFSFLFFLVVLSAQVASVLICSMLAHSEPVCCLPSPRLSMLWIMRKTQTLQVHSWASCLSLSATQPKLLHILLYYCVCALILSPSCLCIQICCLNFCVYGLLHISWFAVLYLFFSKMICYRLRLSACILSRGASFSLALNWSLFGLYFCLVIL